jgi:hypothetical protein
MNQVRLPDLQTVLAAFHQLLRADPFNVEALCEAGRVLDYLNRPAERDECFRTAVAALHRSARNRDMEEAVYFETLIYETFVKTTEDEQHYQRCFGTWINELAALGGTYRGGAAPAPAAGKRVGFIVPTGAMLGHTGVLFKMLEQYRPVSPQALKPKIYVLFEYATQFLEQARAVGVEVSLAQRELPEGEDAPTLGRLLWLRDRLRRDGCNTGIWVSVPSLAILALSMRVAPVQIFWALRFHPICGPFVDGYISYGARDETERTYGKQKWRVCPVPLAVDGKPPDAIAVAALRQRLPEGFLMGTLARPEKINSKPFLESVARILQANRQSRYLWAGKQEHAGISAFFRSAGVADRCHFVGWVDTKLYAAALDLFLESFPFGTGVVPYQALSAGIPLLSYFSKLTIFGVSFFHNFPDGTPSNLERYPILCARTPDEYVQLAGRLIEDTSFRNEVAARGRKFFNEELDNASSCAKRFFDTIADIERETLARKTLSA